MKKVLFVAPSLVIGGMERALVTLAGGLAKREYDVTVMLLDTKDDLKGELDPRVQLIKKPYKSHFGKRIPFIRHKLYDDGMWETRATPEELHRYYIGEEKYDIEIAFFRGLSLKIVSGFTSKDAVHLAWVHSDFRRAPGYRNNFRTIEQVFDAYQRMDRVVCVSHQAQEGFIETIGDTGNTVTVYNLLPVDEILQKSREKAHFRIRKEKLHIVIVGRLDDNVKGQLRLIRVVVRLHSEGERLSLAIVGSGKDEEKLRQAVSDAVAEDYIELTGEKENPYPYIREADLLVCASYYEGFNLTVAEALILETPVLSTDCAGPGEILGGGEYGMITENSEEGLYQGLKKICESPETLKKYMEKTTVRRLIFDETDTFCQIEALFGRSKNNEADSDCNDL